MSCLESNDKRMSRLIVVDGFTHGGSDLYCTPSDVYDTMTTFKKDDLPGIREDMRSTCGSKHSFNQLIRAYMDNWRRHNVRLSPRMNLSLRLGRSKSTTQKRTSA